MLKPLTIRINSNDFLCVFAIALSKTTTSPGRTVKIQRRLINTPFASTIPISCPILKLINSKTKSPTIDVTELLVIALNALVNVKTFDNPDQTKIEEAFGMDNQTVLLYDRKENPEHIAEYIDWLEEREDVNSSSSSPSSSSFPASFNSFLPSFILSLPSSSSFLASWICSI